MTVRARGQKRKLAALVAKAVLHFAPTCADVGNAPAETRSSMNLIIRDQLLNPPTWFASFRDLTLYCNVFLHDHIVIESEDPDPYYRWIKPKGGMDFVEDFVRPGSEDGLHLDIAHNYPRTVVTDRIAPENVHRLIALISGLRGRTNP